MANDPAIDAVFAALTEVRQIQRDMRADVRRIREQIMALSEAQQGAFNTLNETLTDFISDVRTQLGSLTQIADQLRADDQADADTIAALTTTVAGLQTTLDSADADVTAAVEAITGRVADADTEVDAVNS